MHISVYLPSLCEGSNSGQGSNGAVGILRKYEGFSSASYKISTRSAVEEIIESVQQSYVSLRCELVIPLIRDQIQYHVNQQAMAAAQITRLNSNYGGSKRQTGSAGIMANRSAISSDSIDKLTSGMATLSCVY